MKTLSLALASTPLFGIVRGCPTVHLSSVVERVVEAGLEVIEVTMDSPDAAESIKLLRRELPDLCVGAGTVTNVWDVEEATAAGAGFVVSPVLRADVVHAATAAGVDAIPGAATPTEIDRALDLGASLVKVFPASLLGGPRFIEAVLSLLGGPKLVPTGGISAGDVRAYLDAGAAAVGVGSAAFRADWLAAGDTAAVAAAVSGFVEALSR